MFSASIIGTSKICDFTTEKWCPVQELDLSKKKWLRSSKKTSLLVVQKPSINLVGGAITILKMMDFVNGFRMTSHISLKIENV